MGIKRFNNSRRARAVEAHALLLFALGNIEGILLS
jgi:hypothetical protein